MAKLDQYWSCAGSSSTSCTTRVAWMNDTDKRFNTALDLVQWLDLRIAQRVEQQLKQRLAAPPQPAQPAARVLLQSDRPHDSANIHAPGRKTPLTFVPGVIGR